MESEAAVIASVIVSTTDDGHLVIQTRPIPGAPCPTCGKPVGKSQAQRSREWRARRADTEGEKMMAVPDKVLFEAEA